MQMPSDSVRIVLFRPDNSFLVLTESDDPDNWKLPGGKFEHSAQARETAQAAAARELTDRAYQSYTMGG